MYLTLTMNFEEFNTMQSNIKTLKDEVNHRLFSG